MSIAIKVENLSKAYQIGQIGTGTISRDLERWWITKVMRKEDPFLKLGEVNDTGVRGKDNFVWSLKDIGFEIQQGDSVGIIGKNGAGKSTLLKLLSRVTSPTTGKVKIKGRVASLLEVGTGFHPELTGRENIFLNGSILGMRKKEIGRKLDEIISFSGVERYIDTPVKRYSSGMYVRLAFAVAAHLQAEILIVDEVLAVGDADFQKKCLGKMDDLSKGEGRTVLFVSHNMGSVMNLCNKGMLLKNGSLETVGAVSECVRQYSSLFLEGVTDFWKAEQITDKERIIEASIEIKGRQPQLNATIKVTSNSKVLSKPAIIAVDIKNSRGGNVMQALPSLEPKIIFDGKTNKFKVDIDLNGLIPDKYFVSIWVGPHNNETYEQLTDILMFEVCDSPTKGRTFTHTLDHGFIVPESVLTAEIHQ